MYAHPPTGQPKFNKGFGRWTKIQKVSGQRDEGWEVKSMEKVESNVWRMKEKKHENWERRCMKGEESKVWQVNRQRFREDGDQSYKESGSAILSMKD